MVARRSVLQELLTQHLERELVEHAATLTSGDQPCIRIQAKHPTVGDLRAWIDDDEITVGMDLSHTHFDDSRRSPGQSDQDYADDIAEAAADFIRAMLSDQVLIDVTYRGTIPSTVGMLRLDIPEARRLSPLITPHDPEVKFFLWSGRFEPFVSRAPVIVVAEGDVMFFPSSQAAERYMEPVDVSNGEYDEIFDSHAHPIWPEVIALPRDGLLGTTKMLAVRLLKVPGAVPNPHRLRRCVEDFLDRTNPATAHPRGAELNQLITWAIRVMGQK